LLSFGTYLIKECKQNNEEIQAIKRSYLNVMS